MDSGIRRAKHLFFWGWSSGPYNSILGFIGRTYRKVGYNSLRQKVSGLGFRFLGGEGTVGFQGLHELPLKALSG